MWEFDTQNKSNFIFLLALVISDPSDAFMKMGQVIGKLDLRKELQFPTV
jgi:hypothetical protein